MIVAVLFFLYVKIFCFFSSVSDVADLVCSFNWRNGVFLVLSYAIVKLLSPVIGLKRFRIRILATFILYSVMFGIIALPYWLISFGQPFA
jgi:hypothetical protein